MSKLFVALSFTILLLSCGSLKKSGGHKADYEVLADTETKVLKGYINRSVLEKDTAFKWFTENIKYGTANESAVEAFKANAGKFSMLVVGGTWCHDTQNLLPVFYRLVEKSGFPEDRITVIAVDRNKKGPVDLQKNYNILNVPTFIVMKEGKEVGRVVEYGKEGQIDKELGEIVLKEVAPKT